ncbi:proline-rich receptor-like protein kinase PERK2 isoform X1 [Tasmannia lanceolata]|uniref:proline-rich receptor-like protein kinase PERK2 isoform X1 n=3 Tax=Tasmannia lanceolata TaxID=3420 RepID=UPI004063150B
MENDSRSPSHVVVAYDATKDLKEHELQLAIDNIRMRGDILIRGDTLLVLGILQSVPHPMGYQTKACTDSFAGTNARALEEEVSKKVDLFVHMLMPSAEKCVHEGVCIDVKITAGAPMKKVISKEIVSCKATWVILDRHLRKDLKFFIKHIPCKIALIQDSLSVKPMRNFVTIMNDTDVSEEKFFYSLRKSVAPTLNVQDSATVNNDLSVISCGSYSVSISSQETFDDNRCNLASSSSYRLQEYNTSVYDEIVSSPKQEITGKHLKGKQQNRSDHHVLLNQHNNVFQHQYSEQPILCTGCGLRTILYAKESMKFELSEIQAATSDFSKENLVGEGGFGRVYKGRLIDGQVIAAQLRKEESGQGYTEFRSEVHVLSLARHKNIVMLLGYCSEENHTILVYEYICNKSLESHLFSKPGTVLEWHQRHAIAIGTAKGLRFLHEECRGGPIIHRDLRPSNILLTHDFVPMLGDVGLAKWKTTDDWTRTRYLSPEYAENGIVSVRTDVYAFGIVLLQLISGRKVVDVNREGQDQYLLQWAEPLIERLALRELIDPCIGESSDTYELYHMAIASYLCVRRNPEMRPSMDEVVRLLEGENDHVQELAQQFMPHFRK